MEKQRNRGQKKPQKTYRPDHSVWDIIKRCSKEWNKNHPEEPIDLSQPHYKPSELIKMNSALYADKTITEAFEAAYNLSVSDDVREIADLTPVDVKVGDMIPLQFKSITKDGVTFNCVSTHQLLETRNNFYQYENMRKFLPTETFYGRVIDVNPNRAMVDVFGPMMEAELDSITAEPWRQNAVEGELRPVLVKNLHMVRGGFKGKVVLNGMSKFLGGEFEVDAFVPGSQICLNVADDFEQYEGQSVQAFILSAGVGPNGKMSVVCSVKKLLQHYGNLATMIIHREWCNQNESWKNITEQIHAGKVTGVINSNNQCGIFVEVPELNITGMINKPADELVNYTMGMDINVKIDNVEETLEYDETMDQYQHVVPFEIVDGALKKVNVKVCLKEA